MGLTAEELVALTGVAEQMAVELSEHRLLTEIGLRARTFALYPAAANTVGKSVPEAIALERAWDDLDEFGNWLFRRLHRQLQAALPAGGHDAGSRRLRRVFNLPELAGAEAILTALTATLGVAPAIASVVTALALKRASNPGWDETYVRSRQPMVAAR